MRVDECASAHEFLARTHRLRAAEPVLTNLIGSVAEDVANGRTYESSLWLVVDDGDGAVVGCAMRTAPWKLVVSPMVDEAAVAIGRRVAPSERDLPGVSGPQSAVRAVIRGLGDGVLETGAMHEIVRVLDVLTDPPDVPGSPRLAVSADLPTLRDWMVAFGAEAGLPLLSSAAADRSVAAERLWVWQREGEVVAMAGHAPLVTTPSSTVARIGPVYTPAPHRRRGYGSALTHALAQYLEGVSSVVMLFADAANPQSNSIYEALGFAEVARIVEVDIDLAP